MKNKLHFHVDAKSFRAVGEHQVRKLHQGVVHRERDAKLIELFAVASWCLAALETHSLILGKDVTYTTADIVKVEDGAAHLLKHIVLEFEDEATALMFKLTQGADK